VVVPQDSLTDAALVVRGGLMALVTLRQALETAHAFLGYYSLSFYGDNDLTFDQICFEAELRHGRVRVSSVGLLRSLGHEPSRSGSFPHLSVRFEFPPTDEELEALVEVFEPGVPNPYPVD
jgi:hypothetical protein